MSDPQYAEVDGARFAWWSDGDGPPVVLVHAGVADARMWEPVLPALTPSHRVVRFDMRGFGRTRSTKGTFDPAGDIAGLFDALDVAEAHVVGASFGGLIALELAAAQPQRVASLVLLAPALPDIEPSPELLAFAEAEEKAITVGRIDDAVEINVKMWAQDSTPEVRELVAVMQRAAFDLQLREGADPEELEPPVSARLSTIRMPTTIAVGDRDVVDFTQIAERLERDLPDATLHHIADAGHLLALDQPDEVAQLVLSHLERVAT
ncbi:MAG TPA: alpha/beta hydrolase [Solirubrobacteraceae bacterium]|nr:alpha/beta hydrolase [Solirubrobacteraceae bacterium]